MKPKVQHQQAMEYSFKAKQALNESDYDTAFALFKEAATLESEVAEFYFDKPDLEPTRSTIIRSAAFLNLKAGDVENAQRFIYFGLLHLKDEVIKDQLNNALELAVGLKNMKPQAASSEYNYLGLLRQRSVHYILEPVTQSFGNSVSLEMIKDFSDGYLKSLRSYALSMYKRLLDIKDDIDEAISKEFERLINPLVTSSAHGSFKFSIANDFLVRIGEKKDVVQLKANIIDKYHKEIFTNPLGDEDIEKIKKTYSEEEVNDIFRPLTRIKANKTPYKVGYYDSDNFNKVFVDRIVNKQRKKLLTTKQLSQDDIGELESSIVHKRSSQSGKVTKKTIIRERLKSYEFDIPTKIIEPKDQRPILLVEEILLSVSFDSETGFTISFDDLQVENTDVEYQKTLTGFYNLMFDKIFRMKDKGDMNVQEMKDWDIIKNLIGNTEALNNPPSELT